MNSNLLLEYSSEQPCTLNQFPPHAKTISVPVSQNQAPYYSLGSMNSKFNNWRPSGRLITTLYEHQNPVHSLAITDDSSYFITASKGDRMIKIWVTSDIEKDVTSHSVLSI